MYYFSFHQKMMLYLISEPMNLAISAVLR